MSRCVARKRADARAYADGFEAHTLVAEAETRGPAKTPTDHWCVEVKLVPAAGGWPPSVQGYCSRHGLTVRTVQPQADHWQAVVAV
jgi:hypothetical protein